MYKFQVKDPLFLPHCGSSVEFSINKGELILIMGENGVGKSTLAQRLFFSSNNTSLIEQRDTDYFFDRSLKKVKEIFLTSFSTNENREFFLKIWNRFNLNHKEDRLLSSLSGGEGQALKLCLGLSVPKDVYFLDEPSQYLDSNVKMTLQEVIAELLQLNKAIVIIEHDGNWLPRPCRVLKLESQEESLVIGKTWTI